MDWKNLFTNRILDRGYDYYSDDAVGELDVTNDSITASVYGSEEYDVKITLKNGEIEDMFCTCPYADEGYNCKHMAAVLYKYENDNGIVSSSNKENDSFLAKFKKNLNNVKEIDKTILFDLPSSPINDNFKRIEIKKLIDNVDINDIKSFLENILVDDEKLTLRFYNYTKKKFTFDDIKIYLNRITGIFNKYSKLQNHIKSSDALSFSMEIEEIIYNDVKIMIDNKKYFIAFKILNHIFLNTVSIEIDEKVVNMILNLVEEYWCKIINEIEDVDEKIQVFNWFTLIIRQNLLLDNTRLENMIYYQFHDDLFTALKIEYVEERLIYAESITNKAEKDELIGALVLNYIDLLALNDKTKSKISNVYKNYWSNIEVRQNYIRACIDNKQYNNALKALDESLELDKDYKGLALYYSKIKKELYVILQDKPSYIREVWKLLTIYDRGNLEYYNELKSQYNSEEWIVKREQVFATLLQDGININLLYNEEKLYDRLLDSIISNGGYDELLKYVDVLKDLYPTEILTKYEDEVNKLAKNTGSRRYYFKLIEILRKMKEIKDGDKVVKRIIIKWKEIYHNRRVMMEELERL